MDPAKRINVHMTLGQLKSCLDRCPAEEVELHQLLSGVMATYSSVPGYEHSDEEENYEEDTGV